MHSAADGNRPNSFRKPGPIDGPVTVVEGETLNRASPAPPGVVPDNGDIVPAPAVDVPETPEGMTSAASAEPAAGTPLWFDHFLLVTCLTAMVAVLLLILAQRLAAEYQRLSTASSAAGTAYAACLLLVTSCVLLLSARSWNRYRRIQLVARLRRQAAAVEAGSARPDDVRQLRAEWNRYLHELGRHGDQRTRHHIGHLRSQLRAVSGDPVRHREIVEACLLEPLDRRADTLIERRAVQVAIATALASRTFDGLIVFWQSSRLIRELAELYCGRPGVWGTLRLLRQGMAMVVFAEGADLASQALTEVIAGKSLAVLGGRTAEGTANGLMILRLGEAVRQQCRPVPGSGSTRHPLRRLAAALTSQLGKRAEVEPAVS